jgi:putative transposase
MKRVRFTEEQIIGVLKEHEAGAKTADLPRKHGVSEGTLYNWKAKYGGMDVSEAKRLKQLEDENSRLKKLLAEAMLDASALRELERAQTMRLEAVAVPQTLDGAKRYADSLGHRAASPMRGLARRFGAGERQHFGDDAGRKRSPSGLARLVAQETSDPLLAISLLPAPNGRAADADLMGDLQHRQTLGRKENDPRPLHVLERAAAVAGEQSLAIFRCQ